MKTLWVVAGSDEDLNKGSPGEHGAPVLEHRVQRSVHFTHRKMNE